ncbi:MAG: hypothetical protein GDA36_07965 [Rhodobacteraceae bacterium]|nr:hypothetical protein [Paracoccaceae bacterium]
MAILSGPLALQQAKRFWRSGYAVAGVCGLGVILLALPRRFCPITTIASRASCFGQPELSGGAASWHRHCSISQAAFGDQPAPALFPSP